MEKKMYAPMAIRQTISSTTAQRLRNRGGVVGFDPSFFFISGVDVIALPHTKCS
jgi:hypothetical protein